MAGPPDANDFLDNGSHDGGPFFVSAVLVILIIVVCCAIGGC